MKLTWTGQAGCFAMRSSNIDLSLEQRFEGRNLVNDYAIDHQSLGALLLSGESHLTISKVTHLLYNRCFSNSQNDWLRTTSGKKIYYLESSVQMVTF